MKSLEVCEKEGMEHFKYKLGVIKKEGNQIKSGGFRSLLSFLSGNFKLSTKGKKEKQNKYLFLLVYLPSLNQGLFHFLSRFI